LVTRRCRPVTSPGITRSFPRLCPAVGEVTVALLTLAPRPARGVRLACLIHAANVHSEPGSNPSTCGPPADVATGGRAPRRVEEIAGRPGRGPRPADPERAEPPRDDPAAVRTAMRSPPRAAHAGFPQGSTSSDSDDRPDCQRKRGRQHRYRCQRPVRPTPLGQVTPATTDSTSPVSIRFAAIAKDHVKRSPAASVPEAEPDASRVGPASGKGNTTGESVGVNTPLDHFAKILQSRSGSAVQIACFVARILGFGTILRTRGGSHAGKGVRG
jgi:hypothetical protein